MNSFFHGGLPRLIDATTGHTCFLEEPRDLLRRLYRVSTIQNQDMVVGSGACMAVKSRWSD